MKLFDLDNEHEALRDLKWDADRALSTLQAIVENVETHFDEAKFWPTHPDDEATINSPLFTSLYKGASSNIAVLHFLEREGAVKLRRNYCPYLETVFASFLKHPDAEENAPGYLFGRAGISWAGFESDPRQIWADRAYEACAEAIPRVENELMWGAPGALVVSERMQKLTRESRWQSLIEQAVNHLFATWYRGDDHQAWIWKQDLYGKTSRYLGAVHGTFGNLHSLLQAQSWLKPAQKSILIERSVECAIATATREGPLANWCANLNRPDYFLVQFCHGAPGAILALDGIPLGISPKLDEVLEQGGELIWKAGPLQHRYGLCHGTAGNAYALLKLYQRTAKTLWLSRAQRFLMHAIEQSEVGLREVGRRRMAVLTGDLGLALALWDCLNDQTQGTQYFF